MMKKTIAAILLAGVAGVAGLAQAADNAISTVSSGVYIENTAAGCSLLRDRVTINVSNGTTMVYNCLLSAVKINVGTCHASGSQKPTTVPCAAVGEANGNPIYNGSNCTAEGVVSNPPMTTSIAGRRGFTASTVGGSASATDLGSTTCNLASLRALPGVAQ